MVLNQITFFSVLGIPMIAWGGMVTFAFLIATIYTGAAHKPIKAHRILALITAVLALIHGTLGILAFI